jgi:hypothetical protein
MGERRGDRAEPPGPWPRAAVALVTLGVAAYGVACLVRGRLVSEGVALEGAPARVVGATIAALAVFSLARTIFPRKRKR